MCIPITVAITITIISSKNILLIILFVVITTTILVLSVIIMSSATVHVSATMIYLFTTGIIVDMISLLMLRIIIIFHNVFFLLLIHVDSYYQFLIFWLNHYVIFTYLHDYYWSCYSYYIFLSLLVKLCFFLHSQRLVVIRSFTIVVYSIRILLLCLFLSSLLLLFMVL